MTCLQCVNTYKRAEAWGQSCSRNQWPELKQDRQRGQFRCLGLFEVLCSLQCLPLALFQYVRHCRHLRYHREPQTALNTLVCNFIESKVSFFTVVHNYKNIYDSTNLLGLIVDSPPILIFFLIHTWKNTDAKRNLSLDPSACMWAVHSDLPCSHFPSAVLPWTLHCSPAPDSELSSTGLLSLHCALFCTVIFLSRLQCPARQVIWLI